MAALARFMVARVGFAAPLLLLACASTAPSAPTSRPVPARFIIDSHQHFEAKPDYIDRLVRIYRPRHAMACVLAPMSDFETLRRAAADHPDVVIPYGRIKVDEPEALQEVETFAAAGFKGIKMHSPRYNWDDARYFPIYEAILKHGMVALFHTGIGAHGAEVQHTSMARMRPAYLDSLAREYPALRIQGAHLGNPWYEEAAEATRWAPNLYFDVTGSSLLKKKDDLAYFKSVLWWEGPTKHSAPTAVYAFEKLVFGTDQPPEDLDLVIRQFEDMLDACHVPEASRRKIYGETMARILGIPARPVTAAPPQP